MMSKTNSHYYADRISTCAEHLRQMWINIEPFASSGQTNYMIATIGWHHVVS